MRLHLGAAPICCKPLSATIVACLMLLCCSLPSIAASEPASQQSAASPYLLAVDDQISITVLGHPEFSITATLLPDGTFNFPVIGSVHAAGQTAPQIASLLATDLSKSGQLNQPQVTITVLQSQPRRVSVIGSVKTPGLFEYKNGWKLLDALAASGGLAQEPQLTQVTLVKAGASQGIPVDMVKLLNGNDLSQNAALDPGDILMVQARDPDLAEVQVTGDVVRPGQYVVTAGGAPVLSVITQAGGATPDAALTRVQIMHAGQVREVNLRTAMNKLNTSVNEIRVFAGDTVVVPENKAQIAVFGEVNRPSVYTIPDGDPVPVSMALSLAGGLTDDSDKKKISIIHRGPADKPIVTTINLSDYLASNNDLELQQGDVLFVPSRHKGHGGTESLGGFSALGGIAALLRVL